MNVRLVSENSDLQKLCREIRSDFPGTTWELSTATGEDPGASNADLHIWDFRPDMDLPLGVEQSLSSHFFLVERRDVASFHRCVGRTDATILLKPVTRATLSAFIGLAASAHADRASTGHGLRADRDEFLQCLIQANLKLQEFDQDRTNFLARALHDFRAPLTAIIGYCNLLQTEALGPLHEDQKEVLRRMHRSAKRLSRMTSAMFQLSAGRHVKRHLDRSEADIQECIQQALHEAAPIANAKDILISVNLEPQADPLYLAPGLIEQVVLNLLDNACKFTPKAGEIEMRGYPSFWDRRSVKTVTGLAVERRRQASRKPNVYRVDIVDSGSPVPAEHLENIFEEYTSYSGGHDRSGEGLGLAICKMIVTQHDGRIWAENSAKGPAFSFVLPFGSANPISLRDVGEV